MRIPGDRGSCSHCRTFLRDSLLPVVRMAQDAAQLAEFAQQIQQKLLAEDASEPSIPGNRPYKQAGGHRMAPEATEDCVSCGACAARAPFVLSTRVTPNEQLARRASPACAALPYVREVLVRLIPTSYPLFPRC